MAQSSHGDRQPLGHDDDEELIWPSRGRMRRLMGRQSLCDYVNEGEGPRSMKILQDKVRRQYIMI